MTPAMGTDPDIAGDRWRGLAQNLTVLQLTQRHLPEPLPHVNAQALGLLQAKGGFDHPVGAAMANRRHRARREWFDHMGEGQAHL